MAVLATCTTSDSSAALPVTTTAHSSMSTTTGKASLRSRSAAATRQPARTSCKRRSKPSSVRTSTRLHRTKTATISFSRFRTTATTLPTSIHSQAAESPMRAWVRPRSRPSRSYRRRRQVFGKSAGRTLIGTKRQPASTAGRSRALRRRATWLRSLRRKGQPRSKPCRSSAARWWLVTAKSTSTCC